MKNKRKGFTLVELLVVIAILAVLASVTVVGYFSFTDKAKESNDIAFAKQLNTILLADEQVNGKHKTLYDALNAVEENGYVVEKLTPTKKNNSFLWDEETNNFVLLNENGEIIFPNGIIQQDKTKLWKIVDRYETNTEYSQYLKDVNYPSNEKITVSTGIDVGKNKENIEILYVNNTNTSKNLNFRTNGGTLVVDGYVDPANLAIGDTVNHYGYSESTIVKKVANNSYHEYGNSVVVKALQGRIVVEREGKIGTGYNITGATNTTWIGITPKENTVTQDVCSNHMFGNIEYMDVVKKNEIIRVKYQTCSNCGHVQILEDAVSIRVTPETAQEILDGYNPITKEHISLVGKTIRFSKGNYGDLVIRPTAKSFKDTKYYESTGGNPKTEVVVNEVVGTTNFKTGTIRTYYRNINSLILEGEDGVIINSFGTVQGHLYGSTEKPMTDPVTGFVTDSGNNSSYSNLMIKMFSARNIEFTNTFSYGAYYNNELVLENTSFYNCKFKGQTGHALTFVGNYGYCADLIIDNCSFTNSQESKTGLYITNMTGNIIVKNSTFDGCKYNGIQIGNDIKKESGKYVTGKMNIIIEGNKFINCFSRPIKLHGIYLENGSATIENNYITSAIDGKAFIQNSSVDKMTFYVGKNNYYKGQQILENELLIVDDVTSNPKFEGCTNK